ncbi:MAG: nuclease-related domain-containing protein [Woeseiaceae bacterium]|nr:nuclease-related domain-containing protein [Woeseiaceae bacterium]
MTEFFTDNFQNGYWLPIILVALLLTWFLVRLFRKDKSLSKALDDIAYERIEGMLVPNSEGGEIQIDHLVLTAKGLLIVDVKDVKGTVFGSDKMEHWTCIAENRQFKFNNPQTPLYDRIAAVHGLVNDIPIAGRVVFLEGADFTKGVPSLVTSIDGLIEEFGVPDKEASQGRVEQFMPQWELIYSASNALVTGRMVRKRP